jgi:predicted dehydrogenase
MQTSKRSRRSFLKRTIAGAGGALALPHVIPAAVLGAEGRTAPNDRIGMAFIGVGGMGTGNLRAFLGDKRVQAVAVCDVDANHRNRALGIAGLRPDAGYGDFRKVLSREDVDAVMVATPDHWHALITVAACRAGKDVYCEKPLAASIREGRIVSDVVRKEERVLQCGTWRRSMARVRTACELVRNGYIGELQAIEVGVPGQFQIRGGYTGLEKPTQVPETFDYAMWIGPAPEAPYTPARCHFNFRWVREYAPGYITDWGAHFLDVAQWGNGTDDTAPVAISATDVRFRETGIYDAPEGFNIQYRYANGVRMTMVSTADSRKHGTRFIGSDGWVFSEGNRMEARPVSLLKEKLKDAQQGLYVSTHHQRNFIDCVLSRNETAVTAETAHRVATCCHLGAVSASARREIIFDPKTETFPRDDDAARLAARPMRAPWRLES